MNSSIEAVEAEGEGGTTSSSASSRTGSSSSSVAAGAFMVSSMAWDWPVGGGFNPDKVIFMF